MKHNRLKRWLSLAVTAALIVSALSGIALAADSNNTKLQKLTDSYTYLSENGVFTLTSASRFYVVSSSEPDEDLTETAQLISSQFAAAAKPTSATLPIVWGVKDWAKSGDVILYLTSGFNADAYKIVVNSSNITISASDTDGLLYGANQVLKYMITSGGCSVSGCEITDAPDTAERILQLDCARKYWTVNWIKNLIREASWMGYNCLQLHLTEDQGCRANIWRDSSGNVVTDCNGNDFSWIIGANAVSWNTNYRDGDNFYNRDELLDIIQTAQKYHMEVIPSVDVPTHSDAIIAKFKANFSSTPFTFTYNGTTYSKSGDIGVSNGCTLNIVDGQSRYLLFALVQAYADFFASQGCTKFGLGGDEVTGVPMSDWASSEYTRNNGGQNGKDAIVIFFNDLAAMLKNKGFTCRVYNDCLFGTDMYTTTSGWSTDSTQATVALDASIQVQFWDIQDSYQTVAQIQSSGREVYNCINNYCYYVLRYNDSGGDARDPDNYWWGFHHSTEDRIYNEWNPSRIYAYDASGTATADVKGAYFLIWGDWAGWCSETNVWNGIDSSRTYNLIDRMWSNAIKQWNWDVNSSLSYSDYSSYVSQVRHFPGYSSCSASTSLPAAKALSQATLADHSALQTLLARTYPESSYTPESYAVYYAARQAALTTDADVAATEEELANCCAALEAAIKQLVISVQVVYKTMVGDTAVELWSESLNVQALGQIFTLELPGMIGYLPSWASGAELTRSSVNLLSGVVSGVFQGQEITVWFDNAPNASALEQALSQAVTEQGSYTSESWTAYTTVLSSIQSQYDAVKDDLANSVRQEQIDQWLQELSAATTQLVAEVEGGTAILSVTKTSATVSPGKLSCLVVTTSMDVTSLTVQDAAGSEVSLHTCQATTVTTEDGTAKKWSVAYVVNDTGEQTYTVKAIGNSTVTQTVTVLCQ